MKDGKYLRNDVSFYFSSCPQCSCKMIAIDMKDATCPNCNKTFCVTCFKNPHNGACNIEEAIK